MPRSVYRPWLAPGALVLLALGGCAGNEGFSASTAAVPTAIPPAIPAQALVGRWGLGAYHREEKIADARKLLRAARAPARTRLHRARRAA